MYNLFFNWYCNWVIIKIIGMLLLDAAEIYKTVFNFRPTNNSNAIIYMDTNKYFL